MLMNKYNVTSHNNTILNIEDFIHTYYKKGELLSKMYIKNPVYGTYTYHYKSEKFCNDMMQKVNLYMSMNPMRYIKDEKGKVGILRDTAHVSRLSWLYIDLDTYNTPYTNAQVYMHLQEEYFGQCVPHPSLVIDSGRGMYLLWSIDEHILAYSRWKLVQRYLFDMLKEFGADGSVTTDTARVLRCIGSVNSKSGKVVSVIESRRCKYTLHEIMTEYMPKEYKPYYKAKTTRDKTDSSKRNNNISILQTYHNILKQRIYDLETLLLKYRDYYGSGRENILFLYRYWQCCVSGNKEEALKKTVILNNKMKNKLSNKEVLTATQSAEKAYIEGEKYRYKTESVIKFLNIKETEMLGLKTLTSYALKLRRKREKAREDYKRKLAFKGKESKKEKISIRKDKILKYLKMGMSSSEICEMLQISRATYYRDIKSDLSFMKADIARRENLSTANAPVEEVGYLNPGEKLHPEDAPTAYTPANEILVGQHHVIYGIVGQYGVSQKFCPVLESTKYLLLCVWCYITAFMFFKVSSFVYFFSFFFSCILCTDSCTRISLFWVLYYYLYG